MKKNLNLNYVAFFIVLVALTLLFFKVISPFIADIFIALIMVKLFQRPFRFLSSRKRISRSMAAGISTLLGLVSIVIPLILISLIVLNQTPVFIEMINAKWPDVEELILTGWIADLSERFTNMAGGDFNMQEKLAEFTAGAVTVLMNLVERTFVNITFMVFHFFLILILMFYLLLDQDALMKKIHNLVPLPDKDETEMFSTMFQVTDAIIYGTFVIGIAEGIFGGILFWTLGVEGALFWGMTMTILSMIPILGANAILVPAGIIMILSGNVVGGVIVLAVGVVGVQISQSVIKPKVVGDKIKMHPAIVLLSMIGGIIWLGLIGFIVGPLIAAICMVVWDQFADKFKDELKAWNEGKDT